MLDVLERFTKKYGHLSSLGLKIIGLMEINSDKRIKVISVSKPMIFDSRLIPQKYEGLRIRRQIHGALPKEFRIRPPDADGRRVDYIWAPERFVKFVDRCFDEIREKLEKPDMEKPDMLNALCFGDFEVHKKKCEDMIEAGTIPKYVEPKS